MSVKNIIFGVHVPPEGLSFEEMKKMCLNAEELARAERKGEGYVTALVWFKRPPWILSPSATAS